MNPFINILNLIPAEGAAKIIPGGMPLAEQGEVFESFGSILDLMNGVQNPEANSQIFGEEKQNFEGGVASELLLGGKSPLKGWEKLLPGDMAELMTAANPGLISWAIPSAKKESAEDIEGEAEIPINNEEAMPKGTVSGGEVIIKSEAGAGIKAEVPLLPRGTKAEKMRFGERIAPQVKIEEFNGVKGPSRIDLAGQGIIRPAQIPGEVELDGKGIIFKAAPELKAFEQSAAVNPMDRDFEFNQKYISEVTVSAYDGTGNKEKTADKLSPRSVVNELPIPVKTKEGMEPKKILRSNQTEIMKVDGVAVKEQGIETDTIIKESNSKNKSAAGKLETKLEPMSEMKTAGKMVSEKNTVEGKMVSGENQVLAHKQSLEKPETVPVRFVVPQEPSVRSLKDGRTIVIKMEPEHLGQIRLSLSTSGDNLHGRMTVQSSEARAAVESNITELHDQLSRQGIKLDSFQISLAGGQVGQRGFGRRWSAEFTGTSRNQGKYEMAAVTGYEGAMASQRLYINATGVNWVA